MKNKLQQLKNLQNQANSSQGGGSSAGNLGNLGTTLTRLNNSIVGLQKSIDLLGRNLRGFGGQAGRTQNAVMAGNSRGGLPLAVSGKSSASVQGLQLQRRLNNLEFQADVQNALAGLNPSSTDSQYLNAAERVVSRRRQRNAELERNRRALAAAAD